jgi:hypothetical protein
MSAKETLIVSAARRAVNRRWRSAEFSEKRNTELPSSVFQKTAEAGAPRRAMFGRCYHYALETLFDFHAALSSGTLTVGSNSLAFDFGGLSTPLAEIPYLGKNPVLVHGFIVGQSGDLKDTKYGHAWLEGNGHVMDCGSAEKSHQVIPQQQYYEFWRIKPEECHRYTIQEATQHILATGSVSGWHPAPPDAIAVEYWPAIEPMEENEVASGGG